MTITGEKEFDEIFFTDVRVPVDFTLGPKNEGWHSRDDDARLRAGTVAKLHLGTRAKIVASSTRPNGPHG